MGRSFAHGAIDNFVGSHKANPAGLRYVFSGAHQDVKHALGMA